RAHVDERSNRFAARLQSALVDEVDDLARREVSGNERSVIGLRSDEDGQLTAASDLRRAVERGRLNRKVSGQPGAQDACKLRALDDDHRRQLEPLQEEQGGDQRVVTVADDLGADDETCEAL